MTDLVETRVSCLTGAVQLVPFVPGPKAVPESVTRGQAKLALHAIGKLDQAEQAINTAGRVAQIEWSERLTFERTHPLITAIGSALSLSEGQIDDLFRDAATR